MHLIYGLAERNSQLAEKLYPEKHLQSDAPDYLMCLSACLLIVKLFHSPPWGDDKSNDSGNAGLFPPMLLGTTPTSTEQRRFQSWVAVQMSLRYVS
ncbi:hypothetical protein TNCV_983911 [Trichonephila clavipes]|nr:hypothetical protein TNCV_983911 [Trichonephila clavipes]